MGSTTNRRVLIVDDNRDAAESLAMLLGMLGHEVRTAYDGVSPSPSPRSSARSSSFSIWRCRT